MSNALEFNDEEEGGARKADARAILGYIFRLWLEERPRLIIFGALYCVAVCCDLAMPYISSALVDALEAGPSAPGAADVAMRYAWFTAAAFTFYFARNISVRSWIPLAANNMSRVAGRGFTDVQRFSADWHADNFAGATVRRVSRAMWAYDAISDTLVWFVLPAAIVLVGITAITLVKWPLIGLFTGLAIIAFLCTSLIFGRLYIAPANRASNAADTLVGASLADAVGANAAVKAFGAEVREQQRFNAVLADWNAKSQKTWMRFTNVWVLQNFILFVLQAGMLGMVLLQWRDGRASAGDAVFAITAFVLVSGYLRTLGENIQNLQKGFAEIEDVVAYEKQGAEIIDRPGARAFAPGAGAIAFERVTFGYKNAGENLYSDFSLQIAPGETVALVGPTGAGKSTFVKLVQRLYDVSDGAIRIDGQDVRDVTQESLRRAIASVPQDPALFHRSLYENIAYSKPDASLDEVIAAAKRARAHDFIARLPKAYDTKVGERGVKLSGGERQRVALARAFIADAPILVLDEATSSLDVETEREVQAAMKELMQGRTTIVIAHRLSTVRDADRILVFDRGAIVEQGRHAELVASRGLYARLHAMARGDKLIDAA